MSITAEMLAAARRHVETTERAYREAMECLAALEAIAAGGLKPPAALSAEMDDAPDPELICTKQAAHDSRYSRMTIISMGKEHGFAVKRGRDWWFCPKRMDRYLRGQPFARLSD